MATFRRWNASDELDGPARGGATERGQSLLMEEALEGVQVVLFGLVYDCWRCHALSTALVAFGEDADGLVPEDLLLCNDETVLSFADALVDDEVRRLSSIGAVKPRYSKTIGRSYLSNGCASCDAIFSEFPLFHEEVPQVLATEGIAGLVRLCAVRVPAPEWDVLLESRWS